MPNQEPDTEQRRVGASGAMRVAAMLVATALVAGCGGSDGSSQLASSEVTSSADGAAVTSEGSAADAGGETDTGAADGDDDAETDGTAADGTETDDGSDPYGSSGDSDDSPVSGIEIDPSWQRLLEPRFVSQAPLGSIVTLYAEPSTDSAAVGSVRAGETGLTLFDVIEDIDGRQWSPVQTADGVVGWMKNGLLRPEPSVSPPERIGDSPLRGNDVVRLAIAGLTSPDVLAGLVDDRGLTVASDAFIGDDAVVLTAEQLRTPAADDTTVVTWGVEAGVGDPIEATMTERFRTLAGSTAVTSTEAMGYNVQVGVGNIPSNIPEVFPDAEWVELHFSGTEAFGGLDWESLSFVFDTSGDAPVLLAITAAAWSP
ncbi:MAG: SH3 domain-containing protein [Acidimicrobiales bacterium]